MNTHYTSCTLNNYFWDEALKRVNSSPIYANSHRGRQANEVGFLGEVVAESWFKKITYYFGIIDRKPLMIILLIINLH